jgi:hypothetical protein
MKSRQYTIRNVPSSVDRALRRRAAHQRVSLNAVLLSALESAAGVGPQPHEHHDLDEFFGTWRRDSKVDLALADARTVDPADWDD